MSGAKPERDRDLLVVSLGVSGGSEITGVLAELVAFVIFVAVAVVVRLEAVRDTGVVVDLVGFSENLLEVL